MLQALENGLYLDDWCSKWNDYDLQNGTVVAVYDCNNQFIAKFQFADLAFCTRRLKTNHGIRFVMLGSVRDADPETDKCLYPAYEDSIKGGLTASTNAIGGIQKPLQEARFVKVVKLAECDEKAINYLKEDEKAMGISEVLPGAGVYRRLG